jgi:hypothetical protein
MKGDASRESSHAMLGVKVGAPVMAGYIKDATNWLNYIKIKGRV